MRHLLMLFVLVVVAVVAVGFYQGWFHLTPSGTDGKSTPSVAVDRDKMEEDKAKAKEKLHALEKKVGENKADAGTDTKKDPASKP